MIEIITGDAVEELRRLEAESVNCCVTSPPYWGLRDYGAEGQIGLEETPDEWCARLVEVFREVKRVLRKDATCWINIGDSYCSGTKANRNPGNGDCASWTNRNQAQRTAAVDGIKAKDLVGQPWLLAFALRADGWYLRDAIVWHKPNPMPESVRDRCTKAYEHVFLLAKSKRYFFDAEAIREAPTYSPAGSIKPNGARRRNVGGRTDGFTRPSESGGLGTPEGGRNCRNVWTIPTEAFPEAHFATFPTKLAERCILAGCPEDGVVLDPFGGAGTTALVADRLGRRAISIEINDEYAEMSLRRIDRDRERELQA